MNNTQLNKHLTKYLTVEELAKILPYPDLRNIKHWIVKGTKVRIKGTNNWTKAIKLPVLRPKSKVLINPKDLVKFLKQTNKDDLIIELPVYMRK